MNAKFEYHVNHPKKLNHQILRGEIYLSELIQHRREIVYSQDYNDTYNILMDIREATFMDFREKFPHFMDFVKEIGQFRNMNRKCAFITKNPEHVAYSEIVKLKLKLAEVKIDIEIFSTEEAALDWITNYW